MKIALHDNSLCIRGTTVALYDYAFYLNKLYGYECIIIYNNNHPANDNSVINEKFKNFKVYSYTNITEIDDILIKEKCDYFFAIKGGKRDGVISSVCKNLIMAVASNVNKNDIHGDKYFVCSPWLSQITGIDYVPHMINLPDVNGDLREELNIPSDAIVFGRNGGYKTFDLPFVKDVIRDSLNKKENYYFLFQNTEKFIDHERVIYLDPTPDMEYKVKFINTCDAHLHARHIGESFGLTCGEFSVKNKPIITWNGSPEKNHIHILGEKGLLYNNYNDLMGLLINFDKNKFSDWDCYEDFLPENVINRFKKLYEI
jgi:hypothetical protein